MNKNISSLINIIKNKISKLNKKENENNIYLFLKRTIKKIGLCFFSKTNKLKTNKGEIYYADFGYGIGNEIFKNRPCVIISEKFANLGETVLASTITKIENKNGEIKKKDGRYFVYIEKSTLNGLSENSLVSISQTRSISKKRLVNKIGQLEKKTLDKIIKKLGKLIGIKNLTPKE